MVGQRLRAKIVRSKVFRGFKKFNQLKHRKLLVTQACIAHLEKFRTKLIFKSIRSSAIRQKEYRAFQLHVYYSMDLLRQR